MVAKDTLGLGFRHVTIKVDDGFVAGGEDKRESMCGRKEDQINRVDHQLYSSCPLIANNQHDSTPQHPIYIDGEFLVSFFTNSLFYLLMQPLRFYSIIR